MLKISQIKLPLTADENDLRRAAGKALRLDENRIRSLRITKKAVDSRKKDNIFFVSEDSYYYLLQMLKLQIVDGDIKIRPFI